MDQSKPLKKSFVEQVDFETVLVREKERRLVENKGSHGKMSQKR